MSENKTTYLANYTPPEFLVDTTDLDIDIQDNRARVKSRVKLKRNPKSKNKKAPLTLFGRAQRLIGVSINGRALSSKEYALTEEGLTIKNVPDHLVLEIESTNEPHKNTSLFGIYASDGMLCSQCEPHGFQRITYYPDRPDVTAKFTVTIHADRKKYPYLLSNGNLVASGKEAGGRHWVRWEDPFRKPSYLFAMVAGKLDRIQDKFVTKSRRKVLIEMYVEPGKKNETAFALDAIKKSMKWDEDTYGLEYDLNRFMLVSASFFNAGAMENKGLNIFNDSCVLGRAETAPDHYIAFIERVVGHEYFHNWTGDRVTCRDWFQISLKEGLTVFREQEFCGDMNSVAVERLKTVKTMRIYQFAEDAGAMAHPIRPASYEALDNFYTTTVYTKGAEVVRMIQTLVGRKGFRKGMALYIKRNDGCSATCEDFVDAMADANKIDLSQFMLWYSQAGTPVISVKGKYDAKKKTYTLTIDQKCPPTPGQPKKLPMHMPFCVGLLDEKGRDMVGTKVLPLRKARETFVFKNIKNKPVPSLLRDFSAPVRLEYAYTDVELLFLMANDSDAINRWDAGQQLFMKYILKGKMPREFVDALRRTLLDPKIDEATKAYMLTVPTESEIGLALRAKKKLIDPIEVYEMRQKAVRSLADGLQDDLWQTYFNISKKLDERASDGVSRGKRSLKNLCLSYLAKIRPEDAAPCAAQMVANSRNMTDQTAGLGILVDLGGKLSKSMLALFEKRYSNNPNIMDEWFSIQASDRKPGVINAVKKLMRHKGFDIKNPNRMRALIDVFAGNPFGLHAADGSGYRFVADIVVKVDALNPHASAHTLKNFLRWKDYDQGRQKLMRRELERLAKIKKLSPNCREIVGKSLKG